MLQIKFIGITKCSNKVANILPTAPPPDLRAPKVKIQLFSEQCPVAYKIKWNHEIKQHGRIVLPADPTPDIRMKRLKEILAIRRAISLNKTFVLLC